jgi:hypothetical protein
MAARRLGNSARRRRSDAGRSRLAPAVERKLLALLAGQDHPPIAEVHAALGDYCTRLGLEPPARASVYNALGRVEPPEYALSDLPEPVRRVLHNVRPGSLPGHQVAFAAFNYGDERALSFAAGMPWPCLYRAARSRGFRPKSLALLRAVMVFRGI